MGPSSTQGASIWSTRSAPMKVSVHQTPVSNLADQAHATLTPVADRRHVGLDPKAVPAKVGSRDEDEVLDVHPALMLIPAGRRPTMSARCWSLTCGLFSS
jgi:hypothetical protein